MQPQADFTGEGGECPAGSYCEEGSASPTPCDAGSYTDSGGQVGPFNLVVLNSLVR